MFRAKDLNGEEVKGYWCVIRGRYFIIPNRGIEIRNHEFFEGDHYYRENYISLRAERGGFVEIYPTTLAKGTGVFDISKPPKEIFSSFPVDGVMSKGGDNVKAFHACGKEIGEGVVEYIRGKHVVTIPYHFVGIIGCEIVAPACDVDSKKNRETDGVIL